MPPQERGGIHECIPEALTGSREQLGNLLALWQVLDGGVDLLSDGQYQTLPFQGAVPSVYQPVCSRNPNHSIPVSKIPSLIQVKYAKALAKSCTHIG